MLNCLLFVVFESIGPDYERCFIVIKKLLMFFDSKVERDVSDTSM